MSRFQSIGVSFAQSRPGRATLHLVCLLRGRHARWHWQGILRAVVGPRTWRSGPPVAHRSNPFHTLLCAFLLCALPSGELRVFAFPGAPAFAFELLPAVQVDSGGIYLHQLVSAPASVLVPRTIRLATAPAFGQATIASRARIIQLLQNVAPTLDVSNWSGAERVRITRRARLLDDSALRDLLTATLQKEAVKDHGELELRLSRPWTPVLVPDETLVLKLMDLPATGVSANFIVRFELIAGPDHVGPWQVVAQARLLKNVLVARSLLPRGQPLQEADFTSERRDVLPLREPLDETALGNPSFELAESVPAGQPLLKRAVRTRPVIQRGQLVDGLVRDGTLNISLKVEVLADGLPGQLVRVRNPKTRREFYAKVQDDQTVLINL